MSDGIYRRELRLLNRDVDLYARLRTSRLFELLQEASIAHTQALGMGREKTLDRGILWVVGLQSVTVRRMPVYDEDIRVLTWPGETMHVFFPRHYRVESAAGEELISGGALWMLLDRETRHMVFPEKWGIAIPGVTTGMEQPLPTAPAPLPTDREAVFTVPWSYVDMNGHMNNTRYFDLMEDITGAPVQGAELRRASVEYKAEVRLGEELRLRWGREGERVYLTGEGKKRAFSISVEYGE